MFLFFFSLSLSHLRGVLRRLHHVPQHARCFGEPPPPVGLVSRGAGHAHRRSGRCLRPRARRRHGGSFLLSFSTNGLIANKKKKEHFRKNAFPPIEAPRRLLSTLARGDLALELSRKAACRNPIFWGPRQSRLPEAQARGANDSAGPRRDTHSAAREGGQPREDARERTLLR